MKSIAPFILAVLAILGSATVSAQTSSTILQENGEKVVKPFKITIPDEAIDDLNRRLSSTRLPDQLGGVSWEYGTELGALSDLITYWREGFDWRTQEAKLNSFDQFMVTVEGTNIHTIHQRSANAEAIPLLLVHGWPGSIAEFHKLIGPLTDPETHGGDIADSYHVIAPSLPGFGFSQAPTEPGMNPERIALLLAGLMQTLGYERYAIAGGDWGAVINSHHANHFPERLIGLHSNMILAGPPEDKTQRENVTASEAELRETRGNYMRGELAYQQIQATKPQSLGYALNDSPAGLAAWILEKFHGWTDMPQGAGGNLDDYFSKDELLTNISIYWFTESITSSMRIYYENRAVPQIKPTGYINVPTGVALFPAEIYITPRAWAEAAYDIRHWAQLEKGGHFAALEQTQTYLDELNTFFRLLR
ncbi:MAG: epoxide hydrolase [OM182 bacterium]|nr:epoxide hydrolase [OM182 bacterium]